MYSGYVFKRNVPISPPAMQVRTIPFLPIYLYIHRFFDRLQLIDLFSHFCPTIIHVSISLLHLFIPIDLLNQFILYSLFFPFSYSFIPIEGL